LRGGGPVHVRSALDLGCGTGLCGPLVKAIADRVDGVDLSAAMLDKARALGAYDRLEQAELVEHLERTERRHDLVLAADVFIYVGALESVFSGVQRVLQPGGIFCFSVEQAADEVDFELRTSLRYAHSQRYLRRLAAQAGFEMMRLHAQPIREDQRRSIAGLYVYMRNVGS
jgi:predicted TPR repeat methyltransferase